MVTYTYHLTGDAESGLRIALAALRSRGYRVDQESEWSATAEVGNRRKTLVFGALTDPYVRLAADVASREDGAVLTLVQTTSGLGSGMSGMRKLRQAVQAAGDDVGEALRADGILADMRVS